MFDSGYFDLRDKCAIERFFYFNPALSVPDQRNTVHCYVFYKTEHIPLLTEQ